MTAEGSAELEVALLLTQPGPLSTVLELDLRGGKILKLPIRYAVCHRLHAGAATRFSRKQACKQCKHNTTWPPATQPSLHSQRKRWHDCVAACRAEGVVPQVHVAEPILQFPSTFIGTTHTLPLTLVNTTPVPATLMCDLMQLPDFELHLSREAWSNAGYIACPVKRIGANGEMSAVGSTRVSRRCAGCWLGVTHTAGLPASAGSGSS